MKIMVIGHARHGKDSVCSILKQYYDLNFISSSFFVGERAVRPYLQELGITYDTMADCYDDRVNHRDHWHNAIARFNLDDPGKLGRELFSQFDIYCGLRSRIEFDAMKAEKLFNVCLWVGRSRHVPPEAHTSMKLDIGQADYIIDNNGSLQDLELNVIETMDRAMDDGRLPVKEPNFLHA